MDCQTARRLTSIRNYLPSRDRSLLRDYASSLCNKWSTWPDHVVRVLADRCRDNHYNPVTSEFSYEYCAVRPRDTSPLVSSLDRVEPRSRHDNTYHIKCHQVKGSFWFGSTSLSVHRICCQSKFVMTATIQTIHCLLCCRWVLSELLSYFVRYTNTEDCSMPAMHIKRLSTNHNLVSIELRHTLLLG